MELEQRKRDETPVDPQITPELQRADEQARREFAERSAELLERLRRM